MLKRKYGYAKADSEHCFDLTGFISAIGVTDISSKQNILDKDFFAGGA